MFQTHGLQSSIPKLDEAIGNCLQPGNLILVAGLQGGGKTILAAQLSRDFAVGGSDVLFLSTEITWEALYKRNVAAVCSVPYDRTKDGVRTVTIPGQSGVQIDLPDPAVYGEDAVRTAHPVFQALAQRLTFLKFKPVGFEPRQELDAVLAAYRQQRQHLPDVLVYDYLRHPQVAHEELDPHRMREAVVNASRALKTLAVEHRMLVIVFCQLDPGLADRKKVDPENVFDFKEACQHADAFVGISQRLRGETTGDLTYNLYERVQHLNVIRKNSPAPVLVPVERAFEFQRFAPCQWRPSQKPEDMGDLEKHAHIIERTSEYTGYVLARRKKFYEIFNSGSPHAINLYAFTLLVAGTSGYKAGTSFYSRKKLTDYLGLSTKQLRVATDILTDQGYLDVPLGKIRQSLRYHVLDWSTDQNPSVKGYFKLFRNLRDTCRADLLSDPAMLRVWLYLLANTRSFPDEVLELEPGEVLLKRQQMQETLMLDGKHLDNVVERLEARGSVVFKPSSPAKLIVPNWELYQNKVHARSQLSAGEIEP